MLDSMCFLQNFAYNLGIYRYNVYVLHDSNISFSTFDQITCTYPFIERHGIDWKVNNMRLVQLS